jgi:transposase
MQDHELYRRILGIEAPWYVDAVELKLELGEIHVRLAHLDVIDWPCSECGAACKLYDHQPERQWRHLDTCQYQTILHAAPPRSACSNHGVRVVKMPWAEPSSRFTALFELLAIEWLKAASQKAVAEMLGLSWDEIHGIMERAVKRGLERRKAEPVSEIGVDEKAFRKGQSYVTLVNDLVRRRVLYVAEDRKQSSLDGFWETLTPEQISGIAAVAMDMWDPYVASVRAHLPEADGKIVFDKFHVAQHLGDAVDKKFTELRNSELKTARAWALKETAMTLYSYVYERPARKHFRWWHNWAVRSRLQPMIEVARMLKRRFENITTYLRHRIANAASESINAKVQWVKYTARGFRNRQNFVHAIYFHCGGLDMAPESTK